MLTNENLKKYITAEEIFCCENGWTLSKKNSTPLGITKTIRNTILRTQYERVCWVSHIFCQIGKKLITILKPCC